MIYTQPYTALAEIYDCVMKTVPYKKWARYICGLIRKFCPRAKKIFEFACGTGTILSILKDLGFSVSGMDKSEMMISKAREKLAIKGVKLFVGDMSDFSAEEKYDVALCLYDSINYLSDTEIGGLLKSTETLLHDWGIFIFDISTELNSIRNAVLMNISEICSGVKYTRRSYYLSEKRIHVNEFEIELNGEVYLERHFQRIYKISEIKDIINLNDTFEIADYFDGFSFLKGSEKSERIHFVLKKKEKRKNG